MHITIWLKAIILFRLQSLLCMAIWPNKIKVLIYIFISFVYDHSTKIRGHSYSLIYSLMNCVYISYATFIEVLIYFVHYVHSRNTIIFRTLCPWLYEILADSSQVDWSKRAKHFSVNSRGKFLSWLEAWRQGGEEATGFLPTDRYFSFSWLFISTMYVILFILEKWL